MNEYYSFGSSSKSFMIGAFRSRQQVLMFIRQLNSAGGSGRVINTPHELRIGCGLSAAFDADNYDIAKQVIRNTNPPSFVGFYNATPEGVQLRISPAMTFYL